MPGSANRRRQESPSLRLADDAVMREAALTLARRAVETRHRETTRPNALGCTWPSAWPNTALGNLHRCRHGAFQPLKTRSARLGREDRSSAASKGTSRFYRRDEASSNKAEDTAARETFFATTEANDDTSSRHKDKDPLVHGLRPRRPDSLAGATREAEALLQAESDASAKRP
jgi:hypothetical protein